MTFFFSSSSRDGDFLLQHFSFIQILTLMLQKLLLLALASHLGTVFFVFALAAGVGCGEGVGSTASFLLLLRNRNIGILLPASGSTAAAADCIGLFSCFLISLEFAI